MKYRYAHDCTRCEFYKGCAKGLYETPPCDDSEDEAIDMIKGKDEENVK